MPWCSAQRWSRLGSTPSDPNRSVVEPDQQYTERSAPSETTTIVFTHLQAKPLVAEDGPLRIQIRKQQTSLLCVHGFQQPVMGLIGCHLLRRTIPDPLERRKPTEPVPPEAVKQIERVHNDSSVLTAVTTIGIDPSGGTGLVPSWTQRVGHQPKGGALLLGCGDVAAGTGVQQPGHHPLSPGCWHTDPAGDTSDQTHCNGTASVSNRSKHHGCMATTHSG